MLIPPPLAARHRKQTKSAEKSIPSSQTVDAHFQNICPVKNHIHTEQAYPCCFSQTCTLQPQKHRTHTIIKPCHFTCFMSFLPNLSQTLVDQIQVSQTVSIPFQGCRESKQTPHLIWVKEILQQL